MHQIPDIFNLSVAYNDPIVRAILLAVILDFITGISKAITEHRLNSTTSSKGLIKQFLYATVPACSMFIFDSFNAHEYWKMFMLICLMSVVLSIIENWVALGLPFPEQISKYIDSEKTKLNKDR